MQKNILISFLIPTKNSAEFILEMLEGIFYQSNDIGFEYEIVVVDGGSKDNTIDKIKAFSKSIKIYNIKNSTNIDYDLNYGLRKCTGKFIWTLSSDDVLTNGAIKRLLALTKNHNDCNVFLLNSFHATRTMKKYRIYGASINPDISTKCIINNPNKLHQYLDLTRTSESLFSFISSIVIKRSMIIDSLDKYPELNGSCWRFQGLLIDKLCNYQLIILISKGIFINKRGDNDSFLGKGVLYRLLIASYFWEKVIRTLPIRFEQKTLLINRALTDINRKALFFYTLTCKSNEEFNYFRISLDTLSKYNCYGPVLLRLYRSLAARKFSSNNMFLILLSFAKNTWSKTRSLFYGYFNKNKISKYDYQ